MSNPKRKFVYSILITTTMLACTNRNMNDYVKLNIPEELKDNKEVVDKLQDDVDQLNKVFNSLEDATSNGYK